MANESDPEKKGFAGLSSLVSDVGDEVLPRRRKGPATPEPERPQRTANDEHNGQESEPEQKSPSPSRTENRLPPPRNRSSRAKWLWGIVGLGILVAVFNTGKDARKSSGTKSTYSPRSVPSISPSPKAEPKIEFVKPPVGTNSVLSVTQIRWCLREKIRIETGRSHVMAERDVSTFNQTVADYNRRCGSFRYRSGTLKRATREVERMRPQIASEAMGRLTTSGTTSSNNNTEIERTAAVYEVQTLLKQLGYDPGTVDGIYGRKTRAAIEAFEKAIGRRPRGEVTDELNRLLNERSTR